MQPLRRFQLFARTTTLFSSIYSIRPLACYHSFVPQRLSDLDVVDFAWKGLPSRFGVWKNTTLHTKTLLPGFRMELTIARVRILSSEQGKLFLLPAEYRITSLSPVNPMNPMNPMNWIAHLTASTSAVASTSSFALSFFQLSTLDSNARSGSILYNS
jgi:hypothetical protein